jgi:TrkA domain protein
VVAVIRGDRAIPGPEPEFTFEAGDTVLVMGSDDAADRARAILTG